MLSALWDQEKYVALWHLNPEERILAQSMGSVEMRITPSAGDEVVFVYKQKVVMRGIALSDGFLTGTEHQIHSCNVYDSSGTRNHAKNKKFARIEITEVSLSEEIAWKGQRTWVWLR